jgi:hypothetical protein
MKPPQFAIWMFTQLGARAGDELVDLYPGSGAVAEAAPIHRTGSSASPPTPPSTRDTLPLRSVRPTSCAVVCQ